MIKENLSVRNKRMSRTEAFGHIDGVGKQLKIKYFKTTDPEYKQLKPPFPKWLTYKEWKERLHWKSKQCL